MKKRLLYFTFIFAVFFIGKIKAQTFDYNVTTADPVVGSFPTITQNGITLTTTAPVATDGTAPVYKMLNINSNSYNVSLSSTTTDIRQINIQIRGSNATTAATPVVTYGTSASDPSLVTYTPAQSSTGNAPGTLVQFDFPAGTRYINIIRNATVRVYRVTAGSSSYTLPLDFLSFTAKSDAFGKTVNLNWSTTNEVNTKNFEIQKRTDVSDFKTIGTVNSKNVAGIQNYSYVDANLTNGTSYYRLNQIDNDGKSKFSDIVPVNNKSAVSLSIYPNPVESSLSVTHPVTSNKAIIKILSLDGKTMFQNSLLANSTSTQIDVSQLASGSYLIVLEDQSEKSSLKFIKK